MREATVEAEEAESRADTFYQKNLSHNIEIERLRIEERSLGPASQPINTAAAAAKVVQELRGNYETRFSDDKLPSEVLGCGHGHCSRSSRALLAPDLLSLPGHERVLAPS